ncbi:MAG: protoglobin domain-containing protein [Myxococcota bacterium]|nr:protoglobin domain-containing protein [Myxococcota bacterium]
MSNLDELLGYVGFDDGDAARLRELHPVLAPAFAEIAKRFYDAIARSPGARSVLSGPEQIDRLHATLVDWMATGLLGPHDERFYEKRSRIGRRHVTIGLAQSYMFTAMNIVRTAYQELVHELLAPAAAVPALRSVHKLLDVELAIMVHHYQLDSEDRLVTRERRQQADRMTAMQTMTAGIAHEVRNPLNAAKLQLELLERRLRRANHDAKMVEPCELAQTEIARLTELLNDFLAFARPPELNAQDHDIVAVLRQVVELERVTAERRGASLELVAAPGDLLAHVDAPKLHQLVLNLVRNALEAVPRDGHVVVELGRDEQGVRIEVVDDGPGMPPDVQRRIYEPFFSTKEGGTGLGMSIVHSLVMLHGGTIELASSPEGTRFVVRIPRRA